MLCGGETLQAAGKKNSLPFQTKFPDDFPTVEQLRFVDISNKDNKGEEYLGQAILVIFFDPGCAKCIAKLPTIEKIRKTFESEGVVFVGMSSSGSGIRNIASNYPYPWVWATNSPGLKHLLHSGKTFELFLYDRTGKIAYRFGTESKNWKLHLELGLGSVLERALDLSDLPSDFVGSQVCGVCHPKEYDLWKETAHAGSYEVVVKPGMPMRTDCVKCHVTGGHEKSTKPFQQTSKELQEVGCEECHAPGGPHRTKPHLNAQLYSSKEESCVRCHNAELAGCSKDWKEPKWDYAAALKIIAHATGNVTTPAPENVKVETNQVPNQ
jgi:thiol-disulfide isomerase/thioredoxin